MIGSQIPRGRCVRGRITQMLQGTLVSVDTTTRTGVVLVRGQRLLLPLADIFPVISPEEPSSDYTNQDPDLKRYYKHGI